jgi:hypothetical protein
VPLQKIQFKPGVNKDQTNYSGEGGWFECDKIRFRSGYPEKIGGWARLSNDTFLGVARALWNWVTLNGANLLGVGTHLKYYIEQGGDYNDVTPIRAVFNSASVPTTDNILTTTNGSNVITVNYADYDGITNDFVTISGATAVGGITAAQLNREHQITYVDLGTFTFTVTSNATSTATGGGTAITMTFQIQTGLDVYIQGTGWGAGTWPSYVNYTLTNPFTASSIGVSVLTVTQNGHGLTSGEYVYFESIESDPCGINRLALQKAFLVTVVDPNTYTISTDIGGIIFLTTSTAASGGSVVVSIPVAPVRGWGAAAAVGIGQQLRLWTNDNFGEDLIIAPRGGSIYYWDATTGTTIRAQLLNNVSTANGFDGQFVPNTTSQVIGSSIQRFVIAFGSNPYDPLVPNNTFDPLLVRWSDQENPFDWVPSATNQSGEYRLNVGSFIMCARSTRQEILVWSNAALYSMQYLGPPYVWGFQLLQDNITIMSPNASITVNNVTYWMGTDKFFVYTGRVETLQSTLWQYVFQDINKDQAFQVFAGSNEAFNEVWWFYCSQNSNRVDKYVIYNYVERIWYYGSLDRTAWFDSGLRQYPMAANYDNRVLYQENGCCDGAGLTPVPFTAYIQSSDFDIGDGHNFGFVWRILPDVNFNGSTTNNPSVTMTVKPRVNAGTPYGPADNPRVTSADNFSVQNTYEIQEFTGQVYTRIRGRQMSFRIESTDLGVAWQLGSPRIDIKQDGRR